MNPRDDIVIRPDLSRAAGTPQDRAKELRRMHALEAGKGSPVRVLRRLRRLRKVKRLRALRSARLAKRVAARGAVEGLVGEAGGTALRVGARAVLSIPGLIVAAVVASIVVVTRLVSGRSFENMGDQVKEVLLGDLDEEARASIETRQKLQGNQNLVAFVGQQDKTGAQVKRVFTDLRELRKRELIGASMLQRDKSMQVQGVLDMIILRVRNAFVGEPSGKNRLDRLAEAIKTQTDTKTEHRGR